MDNLSHALSGMGAAELIHRCLPQEGDPAAQRGRRRLMLVTGLLAASFPDLDLVLTPLLPEPLGYLLHHRGHTHTFLYLLPQALLLAALLTLLWPGARRLLLASRTASAGFGLSLAAGLVLHILMDFLNSYGIHPFHPFDSSWYYGDMVFIIEPLFWVAFGVPLLLLIRRAWLRLALLGCLAAALVYFTVQGFLLWQSLLALAAVGAALVLVRRVGRGEGAAVIVAGFAAGLVFVGTQAVATKAAQGEARRGLQAMNPGTEILDVALTPFPANPACWMFASIERAGDSYLARSGVLSATPGVLPVVACPAAFSRLQAEPRDDGQPLVIHFTHRGDLAGLRSLYEQDCHLRAWMRFARIPAHLGRQAADIRFSRSEDNFTAIDLDRMAGISCPGNVPQWGVPRLDLLELPKLPEWGDAGTPAAD